MGRKRLVNDDELLILLDQGLTHDQMAQKFGVGRSAVTRAVKRVREQLPNYGVPTVPATFREQELDITTGLKAKLMKLLDQALPKFDWNKMSVGDFSKIVGAIAKLANEERLMRGESTANIGVIKKTYLELDDETKLAVKELSSRLRETAQVEADKEYKKKLDEGRVY